MNCWNRLQIEKTTDKKQIKKAYHAMLKVTKPEDDEKGFMELRSAYEQAVEYAEYAEYEEEYDEDEAYDGDEYDGADSEDAWNDEEELSEEDRIVIDWQKRIAEVYKDYTKRIDVNCWERLLYEDIPAQIRYYERCRSFLYWQIVSSNSYLPYTVTKLMDNFFSYAGTEVERAKNNNTEQSRRLNKKLKLNEIIEFTKMLVTEEAESHDIDWFFALYTELCGDVLSWEDASFVRGILHRIREVYDQTVMSYLPYECLAVALQMSKKGIGKTKEAIDSLKEKYRDATEVRLLEAEYVLYQGECEQAKALLKVLYQEIPEKSYPFAYQMAMCCKAAGMYYEAYQLVKYLTWMRPERWHFELADEICNLLEDELATKAVATDEELIALCRVYLRSNREVEAVKILKQVAEKNGWEYNMAYSLCSFCGEEKVCPEPDYYVYLANYPKDELNVIQLLEWEELQARYRYEQRQYKESMDQCNRLLQEYPVSYPVLLLRSHVDYSWGQYKQRCSHTFLYGGAKDFIDLDYLLSLNEKRIETRLLLACVQRYAKDNECALRALEPIKESVPMEYEYCRIRLLMEEEDNYEEVMEGWKKFWKIVKENPVKVPAVSKYYLMDLREIYERSANMLIYNRAKWAAWEKAHYECLKSMADSAFNHPERYVDFNFLYEFIYYGDFDEAEQYALRKLETAETVRDTINAYGALMGLYRAGNRIEKAVGLYEQFSPEYQSRFSTVLADILYNNGVYEKLIELCEVWRRDNDCTLSEYAELGRAYYNKEDADYPKAREVWEEAILRITHSGDYWIEDNLYYDIADSYGREKNWKEAFRYLKLGARKTKNQKVRDLYALKYAEIYSSSIWEYVEVGAIEKVQELAEKVPEPSRKYMNYTIACTYYDYVERIAGEEDFTEQIQKAKEHFRKDIEDGREKCASYGNLAYLCIRTRDYEEARLVLEKGTKKCLQNKRSCDYYYWGQSNLFKVLYELCMKEEKWEEAIKSLDMMRKDTQQQTLIDNYGKYYAHVYEEITDSYAQIGDIETVEKMCQNVPKEYKNYLSYTFGRTYDNCISSRENDEDCTELIESAISYYQKDIRNGFKYYLSYGRLACMYNKIGKREEAIKVLEEITNNCIEYQSTGDYWNSNNLFRELGWFYVEDRQWSKAIEYFDLWRKQSVYGKEITELDYIDYATGSYFMLGDYAKAYELWEIAYKQYNRSDMGIIISLALSAFGLEKYSLAKKYYKEILSMSEAPVMDLLVRIAHCEYMEHGREKKEVFEDIREEIFAFAASDNNIEEERAFALAHVALAMGDEAKAAEYVSQTQTFSNGKTEAFEYVYYNVWRLFYKKEYEEALQLIETICEEDSECRCLRDYIQKCCNWRSHK